MSNKLKYPNPNNFKKGDIVIINWAMLYKKQREKNLPYYEHRFFVSEKFDNNLYKVKPFIIIQVQLSYCGSYCTCDIIHKEDIGIRSPMYKVTTSILIDYKKYQMNKMLKLIEEK